MHRHVLRLAHTLLAAAGVVALTATAAAYTAPQDHWIIEYGVPEHMVVPRPPAYPTIAGEVFWYQDSYRIADQLWPWFGYWIRSTQPADIPVSP